MRAALLVALCAAARLVAAPEAVPERPARAFLLTDAPRVAPGGTVRVGVFIKALPRWHVYWKNPGEAGVGTHVTWDLPEGWRAEPMGWPVPERLVEPGDVAVYAYEEGLLLTRELRVPEDLAPGARVPVSAKASWLACKTACVPGSAELSGEVRVGKELPGAGRALFDLWRQRLPAAAPPAPAIRDPSGALEVRVPLEDPADVPEIFPDAGDEQALLEVLGHRVEGRELVVGLRARYMGPLPEQAEPGAAGPALVLAHHRPDGSATGRRVPLIAGE